MPTVNIGPCACCGGTPYLCNCGTPTTLTVTFVGWEDVILTCEDGDCFINGECPVNCSNCYGSNFNGTWLLDDIISSGENSISACLTLPEPFETSIRVDPETCEETEVDQRVDQICAEIECSDGSGPPFPSPRTVSASVSVSGLNISGSWFGEGNTCLHASSEENQGLCVICETPPVPSAGPGTILWTGGGA